MNCQVDSSLKIISYRGIAYTIIRIFKYCHVYTGALRSIITLPFGTNDYFNFQYII